MSRQRIALAMASGVASTLLLVACGSSSGNASDAGAAAPAASAGGSAPASGEGGGSGGAMMASTNMLMAKKTSDMGTVVTDAEGMTLYRYDKDKASMSMCTGGCAKTWMPVMPEKGSVRAMGLEQSKISTVTRADGTKQLTLAGWPLYRYMGDTEAGDMNGQGKGDAWSAITPRGAKSAMSGGSGSSGSTETPTGAGESMSGMPGM